MAPLFYCKCSNCVCKATVLVTTNIKQSKDSNILVTNQSDKMFEVSSQIYNLSTPSHDLPQIEDFDIGAHAMNETELANDNSEQELKSIIPIIIIIIILLGEA